MFKLRLELTHLYLVDGYVVRRLFNDSLFVIIVSRYLKDDYVP